MSVTRRSDANMRNRSPSQKSLLNQSISNKENMSTQKSVQSKSAIYQLPRESSIQCRAPLSLIEQLGRVSERSVEESTLRRESTLIPQQKNNNRLLYLLIVICIILIGVLYSTKRNTNQQEEFVAQSRQMIMAEVIAKSITKSIVIDKQRININQEKKNIQEYYRNEFTQSLWDTISQFVKDSEGVTQILVDGIEYWSY